MQRPKKTHPVNQIIDDINADLASPDFSPIEKQAKIDILHRILHATHSYSGFMFLNLKEYAAAPRPTDPEYFNRKYFKRS